MRWSGRRGSEQEAQAAGKQRRTPASRVGGVVGEKLPVDGQYVIVEVGQLGVQGPLFLPGRPLSLPAHCERDRHVERASR